MTKNLEIGGCKLHAHATDGLRVRGLTQVVIHLSLSLISILTVALYAVVVG